MRPRPPVCGGDGGCATAATPAPVQPRKRAPLWAIISIVLGSILALGSGGLLAAEKILTARYSSALHQDRLIAPGARKGATSLSGPLNFLLVGTDQRKNPAAGA